MNELSESKTGLGANVHCDSLDLLLGGSGRPPMPPLCKLRTSKEEPFLRPRFFDGVGVPVVEASTSGETKLSSSWGSEGVFGAASVLLLMA